MEERSYDKSRTEGLSSSSTTKGSQGGGRGSQRKRSLGRQTLRSSSLPIDPGDLIIIQEGKDGRKGVRRRE